MFPWLASGCKGRGPVVSACELSGWSPLPVLVESEGQDQAADAVESLGTLGCDCPGPGGSRGGCVAVQQDSGSLPAGGVAVLTGEEKEWAARGVSRGAVTF